MKKICPLLKQACIKNDCAWYDVDECILVKIANDLSSAESYASGIETLLRPKKK